MTALKLFTEGKIKYNLVSVPCITISSSILEPRKFEKLKTVKKKYLKI